LRKRLHASIDIGSNSALLLIAAVEEGRVVPVIQRMGVIRLAEALKSGSGSIGPAALTRLRPVLDRFRQAISNSGALLERVVLTEAVRRADDAETVLALVEKTLRHPGEVIAGEEEARLSWLSVAHWYGINDFASLDVGAGSSEISDAHASLSLPLGALRLAQEIGSAPQPSEARGEVRGRLTGLDLRPWRKRPLFLVGGTASALAQTTLRLDEFRFEEIEGFTVEEGLLERSITRLTDVSDDLRQNLPGLGEGRSTIIVPGLHIIEALVQGLAPTAVRVSTLGLRHGVLVEALASRNIGVALPELPPVPEPLPPLGEEPEETQPARTRKRRAGKEAP
jgi:exopolyphosphatase/guanosine-5'-triphosphate,3'-diphosphate pyrophosphatase